MFLDLLRLSIALPLVVLREFVAFGTCSLNQHVANSNLVTEDTWPTCVFCYATLDPVSLKEYCSAASKKQQEASIFCHTGEHLKFECPGDHGK